MIVTAEDEITEKVYRNIKTKCYTCHVVNHFLTDNPAMQLDQLWNKNCTTRDCRGTALITKESEAI